MSQHRNHSPEFNTEVPMVAISGRKTIEEFAADRSIHQNKVIQLFGRASITSAMLQLNSFIGVCLSPYFPRLPLHFVLQACEIWSP